MTHLIRFEIAEVHNYGGFFGGDTITFEAAPLDEPEALRTLVIDAPAFENVADRHTILAGMVLDLEMDGERVDRAILLAAQSAAELRDALGPPHFNEPLSEPKKQNRRCQACERWVAPALINQESTCQICS